MDLKIYTQQLWKDEAISGCVGMYVSVYKLHFLQKILKKNFLEETTPIRPSYILKVDVYFWFDILGTCFSGNLFPGESCSDGQK